MRAQPVQLSALPINHRISNDLLIKTMVADLEGVDYYLGPALAKKMNPAPN